MNGALFSGFGPQALSLMTGFALGLGIALLNFSMLKSAVARILGLTGAKTAAYGHVINSFLFRIPLSALLLFVALIEFKVNPLAVLAGLAAGQIMSIGHTLGKRKQIQCR